VDWRDLTYGNDPREIIIAAAIFAGVLLLIWGVRSLARRRLRNARQTETQVDDFLLGGANRTRLWLLALPVLYLASRALRVPEDAMRILRIGAQLMLLAQIAHWATGIVEFWIHQQHRRRIETDPASVTTLNVFRIGMVAAVWIVAALVAIANMGYDVTALIAGLGIGGAAIALATQSILADLFASLSIVLDKPFAVGDFIIVDQAMGTVEHVGLKSTRLRSLTGEQLIVGNGDLLKSRIRNYKRMAERRATFRLGVTYQTSAEKLERVPLLIRQAVEAQAGTRFDRSHLIGFGDSSIDFETVYWVLSAEYLDYADRQQAIALAIVRAFEAEGIEFAYPTRTLFIHGGDGKA
jgi:small-conductance mechanosensitive channel